MARTLRRFVGWSAAALVVGAVLAVALADGCVARRAAGLTYETVEAVPHRTFGIVLGAAVHGHRPSDALVDRLETARALFAAQRIDQIFVSGDGGAREDAVMADWLVAHGVPASAIVRDPDGHRTRTTMEDAAAHGIRDAVICTQAYHLPRSVVWAREVGIDAVGLAADYQRYTPHLRDRMREALARTAAVLELWTRG